MLKRTCNQSLAERVRLKSGLALWLAALALSLSLALPGLSARQRININTASAEELMRLPNVGPTIANAIIAHRRKHGPFKRPQDIIIVRGMSARRYRQIAHLIGI